LQAIQQADDGITIAVRVTPNAARNKVGGVFRDPSQPAVKVSVMPPPDGGKANDAVCQVLARHFGIPKTDVRIVKGGLDRRKKVHIAGNPASLMPLAEELLRG